jgi:hypothetical protein
MKLVFLPSQARGDQHATMPLGAIQAKADDRVARLDWSVRLASGFPNLGRQK